MPTTCAIIGCYSRGGRDNKSFYRIPKVINWQGEDAEIKSARRRRLWLAAINRADVLSESCDQFRVCSDHFISGKPHVYDETNPDWVPNKNLSYESGKSPSKTADTYIRLKKRKETKKVTEAAMSLLELSACFADNVKSEPTTIQNEYTDSTEENRELSDAEELKLATSKISQLEHENQKLKEENECLKNIVHKMKASNPEDFENDDDKVRYYTGLSSFVLLMALLNLLSPEIPENKNSLLTKFQKILLTLMRLRLNLPINDLAYRFGVSNATVSKVFSDTLDTMYQVLRHLIRWPDRDELHTTMPMVFRKCFGKQVTVIIDCFEIFIDRPPNMTARAQTWSSYKHHNTAKYLIGITPQGSVSFISKGWGGRVSDKHLTSNCDFLDHLMHGDVVLADRGFDIQEVVALAGAEVKFPAFMRGKQQLSATEVESTRKIAKVRKHVERVIGTIQQKFMILGSSCPIDYLITKSSHDCAILDKIVCVCCALSNMCPSAVPFE